MKAHFWISLTVVLVVGYFVGAFYPTPALKLKSAIGG